MTMKDEKFEALIKQAIEMIAGRPLTTMTDGYIGQLRTHVIIAMWFLADKYKTYEPHDIELTSPMNLQLMGDWWELRKALVQRDLLEPLATLTDFATLMGLNVETEAAKIRNETDATKTD